jgi:predicted ABC-type ATPase
LPQQFAHLGAHDLIAAGLSPFAPELAAKRAGRLMLEEIDHCSEAAVDFALNTTLARKSFVMKFHQWQVGGYRVKLIFLKLSHEEAAIRRVAERIAQAAHSIPPEVIRRRFVSSLINFTTLYQPIVDAWRQLRILRGAELDRPPHNSDEPLTALP